MNLRRYAILASMISVFFLSGVAHARIYAQGAGRFTSRDPLGPGIAPDPARGSTPSVGLYTYVRKPSLVRTDVLPATYPQFPATHRSGSRGGNLYAYVMNRPLTFSDPYGLEEKCCKGEKYDSETQCCKSDGTIYPAVNGLCCGDGDNEWWHQIWTVGLGAAADGKATSELTREYMRELSEETGWPNCDGGRINAIKHCTWSCMMAGLRGKKKSKAIGDMHEVCGNAKGASEKDRDMDLHNNQVGIDISDEIPEGSSCLGECKKALGEGKLVTINDK